MFNKKSKTDVRVQILEHINYSSGCISNESVNKYLSALENQDVKSAVAGLIELIDEKYIIETKTNVIKGIIIGKTKGSGDLNRFVKNVSIQNIIAHDSHIIKPIHISITLKGKRFLIEEDNLRKTTWNLKYESVLRLIFLCVGAGITLLANYIANN